MGTIGNLFQWARSTVSSQWSGIQEKLIHDELFRLENSLQHLMDTLPAMYELIDRAEWRSHKHHVAEYLAKLKDTVYDADDFLDEFRWYMLKVKVEGKRSESLAMDFFNGVFQGSFIKLVNGIRDRLDNISTHLVKMGIHEVTTRFDKSVRPETSSFPDEIIIFGRDMELKKIIEFLCKPTNSSTANPKFQKENSAVDVSTSTSASNQVSSELSITNLTVLPIVGLGGAGKTTLAQHICSNAKVKFHFDQIIWICVSDDFDVKRLTKEVIESCPGKQATTDNLNSLQNVLSDTPLAAKTLGRILRMNLQEEHWNAILESELWKLRQEGTEILPALRLSYMYLPFHLKRCFSFCAVYPKDYKFQKGYLVEIWVAEGFVEPQGDIPVQDIGCEYFNDLLDRSFFQELESGYVIHDLLHDMAQKVSEDDCFIIKRRSDFKSIPLNVRHLSILSSIDTDYSSFLGLCHFTKLRTLICNKPLANEKTLAGLMADWCRKLLRLRVIVLASTQELPASIGNLKHLRYLQISRDCPFKNLPLELYWLYNLQIVCVQECKLESLPSDFNKLICLRRFASHGFRCQSMFRRFQKDYYKVCVDVANDDQGLGFRLIKNINQLGELVIYNIGNQISKEHATEAQLHDKIYLEKLNLEWSSFRNPEDNDIEVLHFLQPPACLKSLLLDGYSGVLLPSLISPSFICSDGLGSSSVPRITDLIIDGSRNLSSLEHVIHPPSLPALKKMIIKNCKDLVSLPAERDLRCLEVLEVQECPNMYSQSLVAPSLKRLVLGKENVWSHGHTRGSLADNVDCCSLTNFFLSCNYLTSIQLQKWNLPALEGFLIARCEHLTSIVGQSGQVIRGTGGIRAFSSLTSLTIYWCDSLSTIDDLLAKEYLPAIKRIHVKSCHQLLSLPGERFGNFSSLKELEISYCSRLSWRRGFVLPSSLQILYLVDCGDISAWIPSCLQNLASLVILEISRCRRITSIPGNLWSTNLTSLDNLVIRNCVDMVSIGGQNAISEIEMSRLKDVQR